MLTYENTQKNVKANCVINNQPVAIFTSFVVENNTIQYNMFILDTNTYKNNIDIITKDFISFQTQSIDGIVK